MAVRLVGVGVAGALGRQRQRLERQCRAALRTASGLGRRGVRRRRIRQDLEADEIDGARAIEIHRERALQRQRRLGSALCLTVVALVLLEGKSCQNPQLTPQPR